MPDVIIYALILTLVQIWLLPFVLNRKNMAYMMSNRDQEPEVSLPLQRVRRAATNLQESLPAFLALCLLAMQLNVDVSAAAMTWIGLRVIYLACYGFGIAALRSVTWISSVVTLIYMAMLLA